MAARAHLVSLLAGAARTSVAGLAVDLLDRAVRSAPNRAAVLTYHRVRERTGEPGVYPGLISATPAEFEAEVRVLRDRYHLVDVSQILDALDRRTRLPPRSVALTFDDAYIDFAEHAWPVLARWRVPATLFVPTAFPDGGGMFWWDHLHQLLNGTPARRVRLDGVELPLSGGDERRAAYARFHARLVREPPAGVEALLGELAGQLERPPDPVRSTLTWADIRRLVGEGMSVGAHSRTHPRLDVLDAGTLRDEIEGSFEDLEREVGVRSTAFAYPGGFFSPAVVETMRSSRARAAFTTQRGVNRLAACDPLLLRRINIGPRASIPLIRAQMLLGSRRRLDGGQGPD